MYHETYETAVHAARLKARETGRDYGVEKLDGPLTRRTPWRVFMLPDPAHRCGHELRCEVVRPTDPL